MDIGFGHFDRSHTENFSASVLCLLLEVEPAARAAVVTLIREAVARPDLPALGELVFVSREDRLDPSETRAWQRADLSLRFEGGVLVLVEVKAHSWWPVEHVRTQLAEQAASAGHVRDRQAPFAVVLLAPTGLAAQVRARGVPAISWATLCRALRATPSPLALKAVQHWEANVERPFGVDQPFGGDEQSFAAPIQRVAALRALLLACLDDIRERAEGVDLNLTGEGGAPRERPGWRWHGLSVPIKQSDRARARHRRIGLYWYVLGDHRQGSAWLELYLAHDTEPEVSVPFDVSGFDAASLELIRDRFRVAWASRGRPGGASGGG